MEGRKKTWPIIIMYIYILNDKIKSNERSNINCLEILHH